MNDSDDTIEVAALDVSRAAYDDGYSDGYNAGLEDSGQHVPLLVFVLPALLFFACGWVMGHGIS